MSGASFLRPGSRDQMGRESASCPGGQDLPKEHFLHCIRTGEEPEVTWRDGFEAMRVALAAYESSAQGTVVRLSA
ncbi:MAG TPA: Gfo/Idh/MocA family oxidoreductase [Limnochordales bacterium]